MERFFPVIRALGMLLALFSLALLVPLVAAHFLRDGAETAYDLAFFVTFSSGVALWYITRRHKRELNVRDGFLLVALSWSTLPFFAAIPLYTQLDVSFSHAYFEAVSGLTATGATALPDIDDLPLSINLWRCLIIWLGGMGLIVLAVAILPMLGIGGRQMFKAEIPSPMKDTKLTPRITQTAKGLWMVYVSITTVCGLAYYWAGMSGFDALCHAFSTVSLGGFSTHTSGFAYWNSPLIEGVAIAFMLIAGMNFSTHYVALASGDLRTYLRDPEILWFLGVIAVSVLGITFYLWYFHVYESSTLTLRHVAFNLIAIATTAGFSSVDYSLWPFFAPLWILFLCSFVSCSGSTGGGVKMMRAVLLYKQVYRELLRAMHPSAVHPVKLGGHSVPDNMLFAVLAFSFIYMVSLVVLTLALSFSGMEILTAFSAAVASLNNTGPGLGAQVGPMGDYSTLSLPQAWICTFAMLLGRLEIFTLLVVLTPAFWKK
ncbi:MAG: TrkH family potassium uptake protein [Zoogloeaceae bacterium]|jgi:trk system potassium uptake protein TrkH|nr:TrkH family potassium uptake protein [Zoogloeaceae bacterium]